MLKIATEVNHFYLYGSEKEKEITTEEDLTKS